MVQVWSLSRCCCSDGTVRHRGPSSFQVPAYKSRAFSCHKTMEGFQEIWSTSTQSPSPSLIILLVFTLHSIIFNMGAPCYLWLFQQSPSLLRWPQIGTMCFSDSKRSRCSLLRFQQPLPWTPGFHADCPESHPGQPVGHIRWQKLSCVQTPGISWLPCQCQKGSKKTLLLIMLTGKHKAGISWGGERETFKNCLYSSIPTWLLSAS